MPWVLIRWALIISGFGAITGAARIVYFRMYGFDEAMIYWAQGTKLILLLAVGMGIGGILASLAEEKLIWKGNHILGFLAVSVFGFVIAPAHTVNVDGRRDVDFRFSKLPLVHIDDAEDYNWRLVTTVDGKFVIMNISGLADSRALIFRFNTIFKNTSRECSL